MKQTRTLRIFSRLVGCQKGQEWRSNAKALFAVLVLSVVSQLAVPAVRAEDSGSLKNRLVLLVEEGETVFLSATDLAATA